MKTPYQLLDIKADASDVEIKQAYLQKVKNNPPDHNQECFQLIHNAYLSIKDKKSRLSHALFNVPTTGFNELIEQALHTEQVLQITPDHFNSLLHAGVDDEIILNAISNSEK